MFGLGHTGWRVVVDGCPLVDNLLDYFGGVRWMLWAKVPSLRDASNTQFQLEPKQVSRRTALAISLAVNLMKHIRKKLRRRKERRQRRAMIAVFETQWPHTSICGSIRHATWQPTTPHHPGEPTVGCLVMVCVWCGVCGVRWGGRGGGGGSDDGITTMCLSISPHEHAPNWVAEHLGTSSRRPRHPFPP